MQGVCSYSTASTLCPRSVEPVEVLHTWPLVQALCVRNGADAQVGVTLKVVRDGGHRRPEQDVALDARLEQVPAAEKRLIIS